MTYVLRFSRSAGLSSRARASSPRPAASTAPPISQRLTGIARESTADSRNASVGPIRPARHEETTTPLRATNRPVQNAVCSGHVCSPIRNQAGAIPASTIQAASRGAPAAPSEQPAAEASTPITNASVNTIRRTWAGVAPAVRSSPNSRRRWATAKENVEATTNTDTKPVTPAAVPRSAFTETSASASRSGSGSARRRSSPVRTSNPAPTAASTRSAGACTATASTSGEIRAASASVKNSAFSKPADATVPTTVISSDPRGVAARTRAPGRNASPVATTSPGAEGARPPVRAYGVSAATDHGWPTVSAPSPRPVTGKVRSSTVLPSAASFAVTAAGTGAGSVIVRVRSPMGVSTRTRSEVFTTTGAFTNRSGPRSGALKVAARASPVVAMRLTPRARAMNEPTNVTQRVRMPCRASFSTGGPPVRSCARRPVRRSGRAVRRGRGRR